MAGTPKRREKRGEVAHPWAADPSLSTRPPFEPGNLVGMRSGAQSRRTIAPAAEQLVDWLLAEHPDLDASRYRLAVNAWAWSEARVALLRLYLDSQGVVGDDGGPAERILRELRAEERRAAEERAKLGLSPVDHARLEKQRAEAVAGAVDLGELMRRGDAALRAGQERSEAGRLRDGGEET